MKKKSIICDICGKDITDEAERYKFGKYHSGYSNMEEYEFMKWDRLDMCETCFLNFCEFVKEKRSEQMVTQRSLTIVKVRFNNKTDKTYDYEYIGKEPVQIGDAVYVNSKFSGETEVEVVDVFTIKESEAKYDYEIAMKRRNK